MTIERIVHNSDIDGLDKKLLPVREGNYLARGVWGDWRVAQEIDVYEHPIKGLCCYAEDFGSAGSGVNGETDCHVSVQCTGLEFIKRVGDIQ